MLIRPAMNNKHEWFLCCPVQQQEQLQLHMSTLTRGLLSFWQVSFVREKGLPGPFVPCCICNVDCCISTVVDGWEEPRALLRHVGSGLALRQQFHAHMWSLHAHMLRSPLQYRTLQAQGMHKGINSVYVPGLSSEGHPHHYYHHHHYSVLEIPTDAVCAAMCRLTITCWSATSCPPLDQFSSLSPGSCPTFDGTSPCMSCLPTTPAPTASSSPETGASWPTSPGVWQEGDQEQGGPR